MKKHITLKYRLQFLAFLLFFCRFLFPMYLHANEKGNFTYDFRADTKNEWKSTTGTHKPDPGKRALLIEPVQQASGRYAGDIVRKGKTQLDAGYPVIAIRMEKPANSNLILTTSQGVFRNSDNSSQKIELAQEGDVYYWDLSRGSIGNISFSPGQSVEVSGFGIALTDILISPGEELSYPVYWIRSFSSVGDMKTQLGLIDDDFATSRTFGWEVETTGASGALEQGEYVIKPIPEGNGLYRADFSKTGRLALDAKSFPILAVMMKIPHHTSLTLDTNLGPYNNWRNNASVIQLSNGNAVYFWNISKGTLGNTILSPDSYLHIGVLRFKVADMNFREDEISQYSVSWVKTFTSEYELYWEIGKLNDDFSTGNLYDWDVATEYAGLSNVELVNGQLKVTTGRLPNGTYRTDIRKFRNVKLHAGNYPVVAIKLKKPSQCLLTFDTNLGAYNGHFNNDKEIRINDEESIYYWDLSQGTLGKHTISQRASTLVTTFQFKVADINFDKGEEHAYTVDWVRTYPSVDAIFEDFDLRIPLERNEAILLLPGMIIIVIIILCVCLLLFYFFKKKKQSQKPEISHQTVQKNYQEIVAEEKLAFKDPRPKTSAIYLLGGLCFFDRDGKDVIAAFSPTIRQIFLLIFFYSLKYEKGISTTQMDEILWSDKPFESARNNRNVNISKLKGLLALIGDIRLEKNGNYWKCHLGSVYSDYNEALIFARTFKTKEYEPTPENILRFLNLLQSGNILPSYRLPWIEDFKTEFANEIIDVLEQIIHIPFISSDNRYLYAISETIFRYDDLNDTAIRLKCKVLYKEGKKGLAKKAYDLFVKEYKEALGEDYSLTLEDLIQE